MRTKHLQIVIDSSMDPRSSIHDLDNWYRWSWVYAHGKFEDDYHYDVVILDEEQPTLEGHYIAYASNGNPVVIHLVANEDGRIEGRCCYIDDYEALEYVNDPAQWS